MNRIIVAGIALLSISNTLFSQNINWRAFGGGQKHLFQLQAGFDYGFVAGLGYGYKFDTKMPLMLNAEYSFPSGENLFDDFKTKVGGQIELLQAGSFSFTAKAYGIFRRFENTQARFANFGSEFSGVAGIYRSRWFVAGEFGFDKAIVTNIKHLKEATEGNPRLQDGWYIPTAGNYFYGLQTGYSFRSNDLSIKVGKVVSQGFKTAPLIPFYAQLGYNRRF